MQIDVIHIKDTMMQQGRLEWDMKKKNNSPEKELSTEASGPER